MNLSPSPTVPTLEEIRAWLESLYEFLKYPVFGGPVKILGKLTASGDLDVGGDLDVTGDTDIGGALDVTGATDIGGALGVTGNTTVGGTLDVTGATDLSSTLNVDSDTDVGGDLNVTGAVDANSTLTVDGLFTTNGGVISNTTRITVATYTVLATDHVIFCDTDTNAIEADLPAGVEGTHYKLINCGSSGNDLTVDPNGTEQVYGEGAGTAITLIDGEVVDLHYNATEGWY